MGARTAGASEKGERLSSYVTDGIGDPDPNPKYLVNRRFSYKLVDITFV